MSLSVWAVSWPQPCPMAPFSGWYAMGVDCIRAPAAPAAAARIVAGTVGSFFVKNILMDLRKGR